MWVLKFVVQNCFGIPLGIFVSSFSIEKNANYSKNLKNTLSLKLAPKSVYEPLIRGYEQFKRIKNADN